MASPAPVPLRIAAIVALVEGAAFTAYAIFVLVEVIRFGITGPSAVSNVQSVTLEIVIFAVFGVGLLLSGWALWRMKRWGRAPAVLGQLLGLVVGVPLIGAAGAIERVAGILIVVLAVAALICLFMPATPRALLGEE